MSWESVFSNYSSTNSYNEFIHLFSSTYESKFPLTKNVAKRKIDRNKSPCITRSIANSVMRKNKLYKKYLHHPTANNENTYKRYKNKLNHIIKGAKKKYYEEQLISYKGNSKLLWKTLNNIMNKQKSNRILPNEFIGSNNENVLSNPYIIANKFNDYFVNVGPGIASKIPNCERKFEEYLKNNYKDSFFLEPTTKYEVETEIKKLHAKKS